MADPIIKIGSNGAAVKKAQQALIDRYYLWDGTADGIFGPVTRKNVIRYQLDRSAGEWNAYSYPLKIDGIVGPATWSRLTPPVIKKKSTGNAVRLLQEILKTGDTRRMILAQWMPNSVRSPKPPLKPFRPTMASRSMELLAPRHGLRWVVDRASVTASASSIWM